MTENAAQTNKRTASWVESFHLSSKLHKASMGGVVVGEKGFCMGEGARMDFVWERVSHEGHRLWICMMILLLATDTDRS